MNLDTLVRHWWTMAARGAFAIVFGLAVLVWPDVTLPMVVVLFGVYAVVDGLWTVGAAVGGADRSMATWPVAVEGLVSFALGMLALGWPFVPKEFVYMVAVWGLITGGLELITATGLPRDTTGHWLFGTAGVSSVFLAALIVLLPHAHVERVAQLIGVYALVFGVCVMLTAIRFRGSHLRGHATLRHRPAR